MASRNYYVILGVASNETDEAIRAAFRDLAKRHHPDRAGSAGAAAFREIAEAYEVLGDPRRRRAYDDTIAGISPPRFAGRAPNPVRVLSLRSDLQSGRPSREELFARLARNFTRVGVPKGESLLELNVDVALSPEEAGRGTRVDLLVPIFWPCNGCGGRGCAACDGQGTSADERPVSVDIPPMSGSGSTFVLPLSGLGIHNFFLSVRVRVDPSVEPQARQGDRAVDDGTGSRIGS